MVIRINELKLPVDHTEARLKQEIQKSLRLHNEAFTYEIMRQSVDARKKPMLFYVYTIDVSTKNPQNVLLRSKNRKAVLTGKKEYHFPNIKKSSRQPFRPVIVGSGPAGLFCALMLARSGLAPIVLERGKAVEARIKTVEQFWKTGQLDPNCNVQFGEGGAGTFSDGKLNTLIKDPSGRIRFVLKEFVRAGADPEILYHHKPHIGTDVLVDVVRNIRNEIIEQGGSILFESCLSELEILSASEEHTRPLYRLSINNGTSELLTDTLVLAIGHSARDTFEMLSRHEISMQPKPFAVGFRVEHLQSEINEAMYGKDCPYELGAAPYKVTHKCENGRGVYSFCMCPGGYVVNAASEAGMTAVNGMSYHDRGSHNANSAIVVTVSPQDFTAYTEKRSDNRSGFSDLEQIQPLAGLAFQRTLEKAAYECGNGKIPVQRFADFCENRPTEHFGKVQPQMKGAYQMSNLRMILPDELNRSIIEGIHGFARRISGFDQADALLSGIESRTSSPVRIIRDDTCQSVTYSGIFPCGEGAGYAGGITSAAVDGIRVAEAIIDLFWKF